MRPLFRIGLFFLLSLRLDSAGFAQSDVITTYAGPAVPVSGESATSLAIAKPTSVAPDGAGGFYFASQQQHSVYRVSLDGKLSVVAGDGAPGFSGDGGPATSAQLNYPFGVAADAAGSLFIADAWNNRIRKVTPAGVISTVAGDGTPFFSGDGGPATSAGLSHPHEVADGGG